MNLKYFSLMLILVAVDVNADNSKLDAAIGGAIGGGAGAVIGNELGGRTGAIAGGALGAAIGTSVTTTQGGLHATPQRNPRYEYRRDGNPGYNCPPGQAKKGRC